MTPTDQPPASREDGAPELEDLSAAVLCGGRATRFGSDKALTRLGGRTLLERVLASLAPARERLIVGHATAGQDARAVPDQRPGLGPLAGLEAALDAAAAPWVAVSACDLPCLTPAFWRLLCRRSAGELGAGGAPDAVVVRDRAGRFEPLAALYHRRALPAVRARLDAGRRDLQGLLSELHVVAVAVDEVEAACGPYVLRNINRPQDAAGGADPCADQVGPAVARGP